MNISVQKYKNGFTLIELSIVLVIIGLIVGGVLVGRDLIRAAELRAIISEADAYKTAVFTFRSKYNAIPGDMPNATDYFGAKADCTDRTEFTRTCNGNGDGRVDIIVSSATTGNDAFLFFQHLGNANLISGQFTGVEGSIGEFDVDIGTNTPPSKVGTNFAWSARYGDPTVVPGTVDQFDKVWRNSLIIGVADNASNGFNRQPITTPSETYNIDQKIDDGKPATGKFNARYWSGAGGYIANWQ